MEQQRVAKKHETDDEPAVCVRDCSGKLPASAGTCSVKPDRRGVNSANKLGTENPRLARPKRITLFQDL